VRPAELRLSPRLGGKVRLRDALDFSGKTGELSVGAWQGEHGVRGTGTWHEYEGRRRPIEHGHEHATEHEPSQDVEQGESLLSRRQAQQMFR